VKLAVPIKDGQGGCHPRDLMRSAGHHERCHPADEGPAEKKVQPSDRTGIRFSSRRGYSPREEVTEAEDGEDPRDGGHRGVVARVD
jgi:hypothetical protein